MYSNRSVTCKLNRQNLRLTRRLGIFLLSKFLHAFHMDWPSALLPGDCIMYNDSVRSVNSECVSLPHLNQSV